MEDFINLISTTRRIDGVNWVIRGGLIIIGLLLFLGGIYTKEKNKENIIYTADVTAMSDSPIGCIGFVISFVLGGFLRFMPVWLVKSLWFLLGIGFILLGLLSNLRFLHP